MTAIRQAQQYARSWIPVALTVLLCPAIATAQAPDALRQEWFEVQQVNDRLTRQSWWQAVNEERLGRYLAAGVDVNLATRRGWTPLHSAARYNPDPRVLTMLVEAGAIVDARDRAGDTPLHWAAAENANVEIIAVLIEAGADVNAKDKFGWLPIHTAAESNANPDVIEALLEAGAKRKGRAYFLLFRPSFLLKHNANMPDKDKEAAMALLKADE